MMRILKYLPHLWNATLPMAADHLWQSTLFAAAAALLILTLRKHSARIRYIVWLTASLKFLVPFSLLVAMGSWLSPGHGLEPASSGIYFVEELTQPFSQPLSQFRPAAMAATQSVAPIHWQALLLFLWLCGFVAALCIWTARWRRVATARRHATALSEGREVSALRRTEHATGRGAKLQLLVSQTSLEPGVFGIFRPVLLWPKSISERLDDSHLDAVLAHELCHVRRQDNLAAALHMLVEALFWFHPLVWWLGARLIEERERACDEAVIELGNQRHTYAESILKVCKFCVSSPLTCVSGVTGADLKRRMVQIMTDRIVPKLNFKRKLLLWTAAWLALVVPIAYGVFNPTPSRAETALGTMPKYTNVTIKPHPQETSEFAKAKMMVSLIDANFTASNVSAQALLQLAYHIPNTQVVGAPDWLGSAKFDINARVDKATADEVHQLSENQRGTIAAQMLRGLLADQFKLKVHQEARDLSVYELTVAQGGSKLQKGSERGFMHMGMGVLTSNGAPLELLTAQLSMRLGRTVIDKTGLTGNFAFNLHWAPDADEQARMHRDELIASDTSASNSSAPPLLTAIQEQLGLELQPRTERVPVLVMDHIEQPE
jgi:bla regulator protein blaR1